MEAAYWFAGIWQIVGIGAVLAMIGRPREPIGLFTGLIMMLLGGFFAFLFIQAALGY